MRRRTVAEQTEQLSEKYSPDIAVKDSTHHTHLWPQISLSAVLVASDPQK